MTTLSPALRKLLELLFMSKKISVELVEAFPFFQARVVGKKKKNRVKS